jgi:hypothetical protein
MNVITWFRDEGSSQWGQVPYGDGYGYLIYGRFHAFRSYPDKPNELVGTFPTMAKAKAACQQHLNASTTGVRHADHQAR